MSETYVIVDKGMCTACGSCMCWSPDVFSYDKLSLGHNRLDDNTGTVPIPEAVLEDVEPTFVCCPVGAIKHSDKPFENFKHTVEFGGESPDNPNINYELADNEMTVNDFAPKSSCGCGSGGGDTGSSCCSTTPTNTGCGCGGTKEGGCTCGAHPQQDGNNGCGCH